MSPSNDHDKDKYYDESSDSNHPSLQVFVVLPTLISCLLKLVIPLAHVVFGLLDVLLGLFELLTLNFDFQVHVLGDLHDPVHQASQLL